MCIFTDLLDTHTAHVETAKMAGHQCGVPAHAYGFQLVLDFPHLGIVMPNVRIPEQEERRPPRQCNSQKGKFIADLSQGSCCIQRSGAGSESPKPKLLHKFIGWAHAVGSWFKRIGYKFAKQFHWSNTLKTFVHEGLSRGFLPRS